MQAEHTYQIEVQGRVDKAFSDAEGPILIAVARSGDDSSLLHVRTDQSGLIGLLRFIHAKGFVLLSVHLNG